ncbi:MAG TPA: carboxylating nicotinate-nucleotide diphosphorylase [Candidatus Saccharimonadales bacterium]|nr:carboxylating nicotinate-nucleotide diphosphorylase [Candidatus Saccharimonadales bacterium]
MSKAEIIQKYFQRKDQLMTKKKKYCEHLTELFSWIIKTDNINYDVTASNLQLSGHGIAHIITKQEGIVAGIEEIVYLTTHHTKLTVHQNVIDGSVVSPNEVILSLSGTNTELLAFERVFVNILGRMSGIATASRDAMSCVATKQPLIAATRKTPWMLLDKKAVAVGGGLTHRLHLADWPMIKDNHLKIAGEHSQTPIQDAIQKMIHANSNFFEIEVETLQEAKIAVKTFENHNKEKTIAMGILLDNFNCKNASHCASILLEYENIIVEASGNITRGNLSEWAETGVDILSIGSLTHSSPNFDFSMKFI